MAIMLMIARTARFPCYDREDFLGFHAQDSLGLALGRTRAGVRERPCETLLARLARSLEIAAIQVLEFIRIQISWICMILTWTFTRIF